MSKKTTENGYKIRSLWEGLLKGDIKDVAEQLYEHSFRAEDADYIVDTLIAEPLLRDTDVVCSPALAMACVNRLKRLENRKDRELRREVRRWYGGGWFRWER